MLRNQEITALALFTAGAALAGTAACLYWPAWGRACVLGTAAVLAAGYAAFTAWRYAQLKKLASYLAAVYSGQRVLDIRDNREGELSLLKNDLYKITVTLQRQADRLEADRGFLARSLGDISHQLRTPLTSALLLTELLGDDTLPPPKRRTFVKSLTEQLERMRWLIEALLRLSRLDAGAVQLRREPVAVPALLDKALSPLRVPMELQNVRCKVDCPTGAVWPGDEAWTVQAVQNVLKNCVEQMPNGGEVRIRCEDDALCCRITVEDTGGGIDAQDLPHLFERFYRGQNAGAGNAGIGLALAQRIVQEQGGDIRAENIPGGARFVITLEKRAV